MLWHFIASLRERRQTDTIYGDGHLSHVLLRHNTIWQWSAAFACQPTSGSRMYAGLAVPSLLLPPGLVAAFTKGSRSASDSLTRLLQSKTTLALEVVQRSGLSVPENGLRLKGLTVERRPARPQGPWHLTACHRCTVTLTTARLKDHVSDVVLPSYRGSEARTGSGRGTPSRVETMSHIWRWTLCRRRHALNLPDAASSASEPSIAANVVELG